MAADFLVPYIRKQAAVSGSGGEALFVQGSQGIELNPLIEKISPRSVINSISEGFTLLDDDFRIVEINAEALRLDNREPGNLIGKTHWEAYPGSEDSALGQLYKTVMREKRMGELEHRYVWADGHFAWLDLRVYPVEGGGLALFFRDVTERHEVEQLRRESEARVRAAIAATNDVVWTNDPEGRMIGEQPGWAKLTGQSFSEYQDFGWASAVHPDDAQPTILAWNAAVAARTHFAFEHRVRRHDGVWRRFSIRAVPVLDDAGKIREWVGVHTDITEATNARLQLARNAETFASLVRNSPFGICIVDSEFRLAEFSQGAEKVLSNIGPLIGRDFAQILRAVWLEPFSSEAVGRFRTTLETGVSYISRNTMEPRANIGTTEAYDWRLERIALPDGSNGVVCYFYDLSEQKRLENELRQAITDKELLAREIEHRVQNSLTIVSSLLNLQRSFVRTLETKEALSTASSRVRAIGRVHQRLYKDQDIGSINFGDYLQNLCQDIEQTVGHDNIVFQVQTDAVQLPAAKSVPLGIAANELITNACKYCDTDAEYRVIVRLEAQPDALVLTVSDTGPGVPIDFSPDGGKGLGLRAVKSLVRQIGGTVVYPNPGGEAKFEITVPNSVVD